MAKINLKDTVFLTPVRIENEDRLNNLRTVVKYITKYFNVHFKIYEFDKERKFDIEKELLGKVDYKFIKNDDELFNRAEYLNYMIDDSTENIINIYDSDVLMFLYQYITPIVLIKQYSLPYVLSHNYSVINIKKESCNIIEKNLKIDEHKVIDIENYFCFSYGKSIYFNRQFLVNIGKYNNALKSIGYENEEIMIRIAKKKTRGIQLNTPCFHLDHNRERESLIINDNEKYSINNINILMEQFNAK